MLKALKRIGQRFRLELAFVKHERIGRKRHRADADERFDLENRSAEITRVENTIRAEVSARFDTEVSAAGETEDIALRALSDAEDVERLMRRHFKSELDPLYDELERLKSQLSEAYEAKSAAYHRLQSAQSSLRSWYATSDRPFFGNSGRELPYRSFFGQDLRGRDSLKYKRDDAASDIGDAKDAITRLKRRKSEIGSEIGSIKEDRSRARELREQGLTGKIAADQVHACRTALAAATAEKLTVLEAQAAFAAHLAQQHGLAELRAELEALKAERKAFLKSFSAPEEKARRKKEFERTFGGDIVA